MKISKKRTNIKGLKKYKSQGRYSNKFPTKHSTEEILGRMILGYIDKKRK